MSARQLFVLGTASQVPTRYRNHNGYFLRWDDRGLLFDPGEGTQRQMIRSGLSATAIHRILITHFHGDHSLGLAGMIQRISLDSVPHEVAVHYPGSGQVYFDRLRRATIFKDRSHLRPRPIKREGVIAREEGFTLSAMRLDHGVPTWGFRLQEPGGRRMLPDKLAAAGLRGPMIGQLMRAGQVTVGDRVVRLEEVSVEKPGQSVAFVMDTRLCDAAFALAEGVDLLICESTYLASEAREAHDHGHLTAAQAARIAAEGGARRLVLTHFSQRYPDVSRFVEEARRIHEDAVAVRDGDVIDVPKRRG